MAQAKLNSPLTERHYTDLKRIQKQVKATQEYLKKCDRCKLDVEQELAATEDQLKVIAGLLREFFPDQPQ